MNHFVFLNAVCEQFAAFQTILERGDGVRLEEWLDGLHVTLEGILVVLKYQLALEMRRIVREHQSLLRLRLL